MKLYKAKGQGIFVNNPLNVIQMKYLDDNTLLVEYKDGNEVIVNKYNIIAEPKAKMEKVSEIISSLPKANGRIENINSINDIQIGDIIEMDGDIVNVDNDVLDEIKNNCVTINTLDILGDGSCIACYTFDNETADDLSGNYNGTWDGTEQYDVGKFGKAAKFDGNSQINCGIINTDKDELWISFWMYWDDTNDVLPIGFGNNLLWLYNNYFGWNTTNSDIYGINFPASEYANKWLHIVANFKTNSYGDTLYINNIKQDLSQKMGNIKADYAVVKNIDFHISGRSLDSRFRFSGLIDQVRIFNRALTEEEVQKVYQETSKLIKKII